MGKNHSDDAQEVAVGYGCDTTKAPRLLLSDLSRVGYDMGAAICRLDASVSSSHIYQSQEDFARFDPTEV